VRHTYACGGSFSFSFAFPSPISFAGMIVEGTRIEGTETRAECELRIVLVLKLQGERLSEELGVGV
jgi:hypothetical protein